MPSIEGKVAVVTGASSGIGEAIVKGLVDAGMIVAGLARRIDRVQTLAAALKGKKGQLLPVKCDVTSEEDVISAFAWVEKNLGPPMAVINNAGVLRQGLVSSGNMQDIKLMFDTNVLGMASCAKQALQSMVKNNTEGTIININSVSGHKILPFPRIHCYNSTKYAVTALTEGLRNEVGFLKANIRVTGLSPGAVESEMGDQFKSPDGRSVLDDFYQPLPASDISDSVLFILQAPQRMNVPQMSVSSLRETVLSQGLTAAAIIDKMSSS